MTTDPDNFEWIGTDGTRKSWITKFRADMLVAARGGSINELEPIAPIEPVAVKLPVLPARILENVGNWAAEYYNTGSHYTGD